MAIEDVPDATVQEDGDLVVRTVAASMCGSDLYLFNGEVEALVAPGHTTLGHEICGEVVEVGRGVGRFRVGDRVTFPYSVSCGRCVSCRAGQTAHCLTTGKAIYGFGTAFGDLGGSHAEYVRVPRADDHLEAVPEEFADDVVPFLSCNLPAAVIAVGAADIGPADSVAMVGCGPTGLLALDLVRRRTAGTVFAFDPVASRREAAEKLGAVAVDPGDQSAVAAVVEQTDGVGVHRVVEFAGRGAGFDLAIALARPGGKVSGGGVYLEPDHPTSLYDLYFKNLTLELNGFANAKVAQWEAMRLVRAGVIDPTAVLTHRVRLDDLPEAAVRFAEREPGFLKMLITP
ncbi:alcohol dehydrogenase catalytic domain-containing protein [Pseudonocardia sp. WMMC193]|uniref:alcohol dehydrogenase catalytic domain-containing protein n=1 Tax=Pseudonocardia sp. WMMC193 TaxID=2911965 RepID=UPI001F2D962A|nr:alcohol dehydrogenase catalytic domain-containing protein [Pseudonocardia sp. WMMC193]MCF7550845.1 alcohol dehydrogenase catalytic domain-containing protein [Pseudonocardia sp. WMMC193]